VGSALSVKLSAELSVKPLRAVIIGAVAVQVPLLGSYSSAVASMVQVTMPLLSTQISPPATRTSPSGNRAAWWPLRAVVMAPVGVQVPLLGSYSSAVARAVQINGFV